MAARLLRGEVTVVGPDGSGKSTLARGVLERAAAEGVDARHAHWRPGVVWRRPGTGEPVREPHRLPPRGPVVTLARLLLLVADFSAGRLGPWGAARRHGLLVVERGWLDMAVDPRRYRMPRWVAHVVLSLRRLFGRSDVVVLLSGDPDVLHGRVGELGEEETARQIRRWRELAGSCADTFVEIDTTRTSMADAAATAWDAIVAAVGRPG